MAISANLERLIFRRGFEAIREAYNSSIQPSEKNIADSEQWLRQRWRLPVGDSIPNDRTDENGEAISFSDELENLVGSSRDCLVIIQESFTITLFHYWERQSFIWLKQLGNARTGRKDYDHVRTIKWLRTHVREPKTTEIEKLQLVANALKHGAGPSSRALYGKYPDLIRPGYGANPGDGRAIVDGALLIAFFDAVDQSAP